MELTIGVKIVLGFIAFELLLIAVLYVYYLLRPVEGIVYYKHTDYTESNLITYVIKIKRKCFGYPFSRTCRVSKDVYYRLHFGDTYNSQTGKITIGE